MTGRRATSRRELLLAVSFALWGLAVAIALSSVLRRPAPPDQPLSVATLANIDAKGAMRWMLCLLLLPMVVPAALRPVSRRLAQGAAWARNVAVIAPLVTLWLISVEQRVVWSIVPCAIVVFACLLLRARAMHFTRRDFVLVPAFLSAFVALVDIASPRFTAHQLAVVAMMLVLTLRIGVTFLRSPLPPAKLFHRASHRMMLSVPRRSKRDYSCTARRPAPPSRSTGWSAASHPSRSAVSRSARAPSS